MFLRSHLRKKNGKSHRYWSVVESRRLANGQSAQRQVLYLGEINDSQEAAWRKSIEVFDEDKHQSSQACLFPDDRPIPADEVNALSLVMSDIRLLRPRSFGDCWLGCVLWRELGLDRFWQEQLDDERGGVPWEKVLQLLAVNRLCQPGSEFAVHRQWFLASAMDELLECDFAVAEKDRLYRCLDRVLTHKDALCQHLVGQWKTLFDARFDILLYDLTSTYFEGGCGQIPKARHGYSRDGRGDCRQVVLALVVTTDGLPLAYEVLPGNTADKTTLALFLQKIQSMYGKARRVWVMDRGVPTEATLKTMRDEAMAYLVGTPRTLLSKLEKALLEKPWEKVHEGMEVKLLEENNELYVQARSGDRQKKENAMRRRKLKKLVQGLNRLKRRKNVKRDYLLERLAVLKKEAGRVASFVQIRKPAPGEPVNRTTFTAKLDKAALKKAMDRDGSYILRAHVPWEQWPAGIEKQAPVLWEWYMQLVRVEEAFKTLKSDLDLRPIHHQIEKRVEAHILVAFLGYCLSVTLRMKLSAAAPGLTPRAALQSLSGIQMLEVQVPTSDGRVLVMPRHTEPEAHQQMILEKLKLALPPQPPPRIRAGKLGLAAVTREIL
ncbi:MAG TPA: IS1634 family transposase [Acidobacteriaceae bacterium]